MYLNPLIATPVGGQLSSFTIGAGLWNFCVQPVAQFAGTGLQGVHDEFLIAKAMSSVASVRDRRKISGLWAKYSAGADSSESIPRILYPSFPFDEIQAAYIAVRGTSTKFSRDGTPFDFLGKNPAMAGTFEAYKHTEAYWIPPQGSSHEAWARRAEATFHAAIERALDHARFDRLYDADFILKPEHMPVLVLVVWPTYQIDISADVRPYRENYEWALVNGQPQQTFREGLIGFPDGAFGERFFRVALTQSEYQQILRDAKTLAKNAGYDLIRDITAFFQQRRMLVEQEVRLCNDLCGEDEKFKTPRYLEFEAAFDQRIAFEETTGWELVWDVLGHKKSDSWNLPETGKHRASVYTYLIGELVKRVLLAKAYLVLQNELSKAAR